MSNHKNKEEVSKLIHNSEKCNQMVEEVFKEFDTNRNGFIEKKEFAPFYKKFMQACGEEIEEPTEEELNEGIKSIDWNKDGKISKNEMRGFVEALFDYCFSS